VNQGLYIIQRPCFEIPIARRATVLIADLNTPAKRQPPPLRPTALIQALQTLPAIRRLLNTRQQQDAHELFLVLAEAVSNEAMKVAGEVMKIKGLREIIPLQGWVSGRNEVARKLNEKKRGLAQPWEGLMSRRRVCKRCGWCEAVRMDTLGGMELSLPQHVSRIIWSSYATFPSLCYIGHHTALVR
jgi:ubiquitin carboxyl-terminal hydrolase 1